MAVTSPDGTPIEVRPIEPAELDRVVLRCWPDRDALDRLFDEQGTIGMAAWEGDRCVAQLHCYRVPLPDGTNENWTVGGNWWDGKEDSQTHTDHQNWGPGRLNPPFTGPAWCHSCFHVGRTLESYREEMELKFSSIAEASRKGREPGYSGRAIGTALCEESIRWARQHDYVAVLAPGAPDGLFEFAAWAGHLPWTTYAKLGFETVDVPEHGDELPGWAQGERRGIPEYLFSPPEVMAEVQRALDAGRPARDFREHLMMLQLTGQITP
jgi:GNAT superfamily N-acetyltransferase